ncbi:exonuclease SbcCD subunit D [Amycolatopsis pithecellobii]|uniref:exonuclease SbcCD subunit D n=1 Tax=Amycolatopsis pithecellobii TaxID=664692 RepID=UPI0028AE25EE|nr:exonuclease SbcCD subunit D [Amycolatopsis pithecellobii]
MRFLHTSDWHVGRTFHGVDLIAEQAAVLGHLAELVAAEAIDVVLVSGDIYDRAVPSAEAVQVANRAMARIRAAGAQLVLTSGNHDSAPRLGVFSEFAAAGGLHLRTTVDRIDHPVLLDDEHGPVAIYGIPYLEPEPARHALGVPDARGHNGVLTEAMRRVREDLAAREPGIRSVVLAHAFVTGGQGTDSERTIAVGGVEQVGSDVFDGVDYVALGHLHGAQALADHLRYSGSPLAYSFSESRQRKSVWLVDLDEGGLAEVRRHELPVPRRLAKLVGRIDWLLSAEEHADVADCYLSVTLTDSVRPDDAMRRLRDRFPYAVHLEWQPENGRTAATLRYAEAVRGRPDTEIVRSFLDDCRGAPPNDREEKLLRRALETAGRGEE